MTNDEFTSVHMATEDFEEMKNACIVKALEDVRAEIEEQYKWLFNTKYTRYDVDIAFNSIFRIIDKYRNKAESEGSE